MEKEVDKNAKECLPDIQCTPPHIKIPIQQVGVENVEVPFKLETKTGGFNEMVANVSLRTSLDQETKGISMSRLLLTLKPYLDLPLKSKLIEQILKEVIVNLRDGMIRDRISGSIFPGANFQFYSIE